jgi:hypothetical protein
LLSGEFPNPHHLRRQLDDVADRPHHSAFIPRKIDNMILAALGYWQRPPSQKRDDQFPNTEQVTARLSHELHRNNFMMSNLRRRLILWHAGCIECWYSTKANIMNNQFESTYGLLVRSEEKGRGVLEIVVYAVFILSIVSAIWQFTQTPVKVRAPGAEPCVACHATATRLRAGT